MSQQALILLVDDNEADIDLTLDAFRDAGLDNMIQSCRNGREALDYLFGEGKLPTAQGIHFPTLSSWT